MSMNQNDDIRYLDIGLPEDIARLKAVGDIDLDRMINNIITENGGYDDE